MPKYQCAIINDDRQIGDDYVPLSEVADWRTDKGLYNFVQTRRKSGAIRSKKFAATERQLRCGRVFVHRDDVAAVTAEYRAFVGRKAARPGAAETYTAADTIAVAPEPVGPCRGPVVANTAADLAAFAEAVEAVAAAIGDLTAAIGLAVEGFTPRPAPAGIEAGRFTGLPCVTTNGEG